ncbi:hypothetical protein SADUNF_Sadunf16G0006600 [Salix dunnii]|uniref:Uncharacterized protein n=1 Tax=Salix dunnii TaxID=1413687 RepID=A0A835MHW8_9ROSI|nr:hypothetical protein SADUNF_Sadunf16G0006600 [Salix dunnii]
MATPVVKGANLVAKNPYTGAGKRLPDSPDLGVFAIDLGRIEWKDGRHRHGKQTFKASAYVVIMILMVISGKVTKDLVQDALESSNLIEGTDLTKSNEWTGSRSFHDHKSLHHLGDSLNPYEHAISLTLIKKYFPLTNFWREEQHLLLQSLKLLMDNCGGQYQVLLIISDGQRQLSRQEQNTIDVIVKAFNPFAVIIPCQLCWLEVVMDHGT